MATTKNLVANSFSRNLRNYYLMVINGSSYAYYAWAFMNKYFLIMVDFQSR